MNIIYYFMMILTILPSQNLKTSMDEKTGDPMMVGIAQRSDLTEGHYAEWFEEEYSEYGGDEELITASKDFLTEIDIETFLGTWCEDSRREVPRLYKILDGMRFPSSEMDLITLDRDKKSGYGFFTFGYNKEKIYLSELNATAPAFAYNSGFGDFSEYFDIEALNCSKYEGEFIECF